MRRGRIRGLLLNIGTVLWRDFEGHKEQQVSDDTQVVIRTVRDTDTDALWPMLRDTIRKGDTYAIDPNLTRERVLELWVEQPRAVYVAERDGAVLGTYYIKSNQAGNGAHVCNCGYIVSAEARGQGLARTMCLHSQAAAVKLGYRAMQFNLVVSTNVGAIHLWTDLGFETVGRLPGAFDHPEAGLVDALVMYKWLDA